MSYQCQDDCDCFECDSSSGLGEIDWSQIIGSIGDTATQVINTINRPNFPTYTVPYGSPTAPVYQQQPTYVPQSAGMFGGSSLLPWLAVGAVGFMLLGRR